MKAEDGRAVVRVSVRAVVETTLHESDLSPASLSARRMREGAAAHRARQDERRGSDAGYRAELALSCEYETSALRLLVTGRADGVFALGDGTPVVEELKLGEADSALVPAHWAQAAMYAHMLARRDNLPRVGVRVLYVSAEGAPLRAYEETLPAGELEERFSSLCAPAAAWEEKKLARRRARDASLAALPFPYPAFRAGQRRFAANVYVALRERRRLFAQAPTGVGKTAAALYPALRALGEGLVSRALFLTARTTGRIAAMDALSRFAGAGASLLAVELTAKDKACPREARDCRPERCPLAKGYFDRLPEALGEAVRGRLFGAAEIAALAERHALCPFELSLALAQLADVVVCDCNYAFDPFVAVDALLPGAALLVDEAHQLPARVRDAMSCALDAASMKALRRDEGRAHGRTSPLYRALTAALRALEDAAECAREDALDAPPQALGEAMERVLAAASEALAAGSGPTAGGGPTAGSGPAAGSGPVAGGGPTAGSGPAAGSAALEAFSLALCYGFAASRFDERYALLSEGSEGRAQLSLTCLDASPEILAVTRRARGTAFFSATLAPLNAAMRTLGSEPGDARLLLPSPFDPAQLSARVERVDLRYAARERNIPRVAALISRHLAENPGHTLAFFPSYAFMARVAALVETPPGTALLTESRGMDEAGRRALLAAFDAPAGKTRAALFAVLSGAFSEGVDLPGERLTNVIVVSTGLPQPDARARAMRAYYDARGEDGFFLTMTLPGYVRVVQAAGRLIRSETDTGTLLLIDARFASPRWRELLRGTLIGGALGIE